MNRGGIQVGDANNRFLCFNRIPIAWMRLKAPRGCPAQTQKRSLKCKAIVSARKQKKFTYHFIGWLGNVGFCLRRKQMVHLLMGERRGLNPRVVDSQSTALIHLATSAPTPAQVSVSIVDQILSEPPYDRYQRKRIGYRQQVRLVRAILS